MKSNIVEKGTSPRIERRKRHNFELGELGIKNTTVSSTKINVTHGTHGKNMDLQTDIHFLKDPSTGFDSLKCVKEDANLSRFAYINPGSLFW